MHKCPFVIYMKIYNFISLRKTVIRKGFWYYVCWWNGIQCNINKYVYFRFVITWLGCTRSCFNTTYSFLQGFKSHWTFVDFFIMETRRQTRHLINYGGHGLSRPLQYQRSSLWDTRHGTLELVRSLLCLTLGCRCHLHRNTAALFCD